MTNFSLIGVFIINVYCYWQGDHAKKYHEIPRSCLVAYTSTIMMECLFQLCNFSRYAESHLMFQLQQLKSGFKVKIFNLHACVYNKSSICKTLITMKSRAKSYIKLKFPEFLLAIKVIQHFHTSN